MQSRMEQPSEQSLWGMLEGITENLKHKRLADVFRCVVPPVRDIRAA